jgi:hypothetical protein
MIVCKSTFDQPFALTTASTPVPISAQTVDKESIIGLVSINKYTTYRHPRHADLFQPS